MTLSQTLYYIVGVFIGAFAASCFGGAIHHAFSRETRRRRQVRRQMKAMGRFQDAMNGFARSSVTMSQQWQDAMRQRWFPHIFEVEGNVGPAPHKRSRKKVA